MLVILVSRVTPVNPSETDYTLCSQSSESVTLDLLTYADLETLRERRNAMATATSAAGPGADSHTQPARPPAQPDTPPGKRYLILTYSVEFDR